MKLSKVFDNFFNSEKAGGLVLILVTVISMALANSPWQISYIEWWNISLAGESLVHWINDGLMAIFFLLIGLELKREILQGELSNLKQAAFPIIGALGGMILPALIFIMINVGETTRSGAGIPMATDIAFAIGILSLLGKKVPASLKVFLTALAVIDDLGAIIIIAMFYTSTLIFTNLFIALGIFVVLLILNRLKINSLVIYLIGGVAMWYFMLHSGVHATITGILLAFAIPLNDGVKKSPANTLQHALHKPVAFIILPIFAMANTCISLGDNWLSGLQQTNSIAIFAGLVAGKPLGICLFCLAGVGLGLCALPNDLKWKHIIGVGFLGGIGFTMSIFITLLAYDQIEIINASKVAVLLASVTAGIIGYTWLKVTATDKFNQLENE